MNKHAPAFWLKFFVVNKSMRFFYLIIIAFCFVVYGNTLFNDYGLDDHLVTNHNPLVEKGLGGLYQIFTTNYISENGIYLDYRPLVKTTYALEHTFFGWNPHISHFFNVALYALALCIIFRVLLLLFGPNFFSIIFSGVLIYMAHPVHTEVVASLKNRDELLVLVFIFLSALYFLNYSQSKKPLHFAAGMAFFLLSLFSKITGIPFIVIIPLMLYLKSKDIKLAFTTFISLAALTAIYYAIAIKSLPGFARPYEYVETPLPYLTDWGIKLGTALYSLLYYIKLLVAPVQLSFYYGINFIPLKHLSDGLPLLSLGIYALLAVAAVYFFNNNRFVSFLLLFYLIQISPGSNILQPLPGVVGERVLFTASLAFCLLLAYLLFYIPAPVAESKAKSPANQLSFSIRYWQGGILVALLLLYSYQTIARNSNWQTTLTLFEADMPHLKSSAKANYMMAKEIRRLYRTNKNLTKPEFETESARAILYYRQAIEAYPQYALAMEELAMIYAIEQKNNALAIPVFKKAFDIDSTLWRSANNLAMALQFSGDTTGAISWYKKALSAKPDNPKVLVELAKLYYLKGEKDKALACNETLLKLHPTSNLPYYNYAVFYMLEGDTTKAVQYFEEDIKRGERERFPYLFLIKHYLLARDTANAIRVRNFTPRVSQ